MNAASTTLRATSRGDGPTAAWAVFRALERRFRRGELITLDGATGTELTKHSRVTGEEQWNGFPAQLFVPEAVGDVHKSYVDVGADVVTSNTYGTNRHVMGVGAHTHALQGHEHADVVYEANTVAVALARAAVDGTDALVAGSMSNHPPAITQTHAGIKLDFAADANELSCCGYNNRNSDTPTPTEAGHWPSADVELENYREQAHALAQAGVDCIFLEMVKDKTHGDLIVKAAVEVGLPVVIGLTMDVAECGRAYARDEKGFFIEEIVARWGHFENVVGFGAMHCNAMDVETQVRQIRAAVGEGAFVTAYPNQGFFVPPEWEVEQAYTTDEYAALAKVWHTAGANAVGGCCGIAPDLIAAVAEYARSVNAAVADNAGEINEMEMVAEAA
jgi:methionine synthase I (cobalamin-dependent)